MPQLPKTERDRMADWIERAVKRSGLSKTAFAERAGVATTTITRPLKRDGSWNGNITRETIRKIAAAADMPEPGGEELSHLAGMSESEVIPYDADDAASSKSGQDIWTVNTRALEMAGIFPGDEITVDLNTQPVSGDPVIAQTYDHHGEARTVLRIFDAPYLTDRRAGGDKPSIDIVDNNRTVILGVVVELRRKRRKNAARVSHETVM